MLADALETLLVTVSDLQAEGLPVRELYDQAREEVSRQGKYAISLRELLQKLG